MQTFRFELGELPPEAESLRAEVRAFLRQELGDAPPVLRAHSWGGFDREFSKKMGSRGWIAMTWPKRYGGHERSALERYVVLEEMLAAGAAGSATGIGDRQCGPLRATTDSRACCSCGSAPRRSGRSSCRRSRAASSRSRSG